MAEFI